VLRYWEEKCTGPSASVWQEYCTVNIIQTQFVLTTVSGDTPTSTLLHRVLDCTVAAGLRTLVSTGNECCIAFSQLWYDVIKPTPWVRATQPAKKFPTFYGTWRFITVFV